MSVHKSKIPVAWQNEWKSFEWTPTLMTNEIPSDDMWNTPATQKKLELEKIYANLGISAECTKHYMSIRPSLSNGLLTILDRFKDREFNYNFLKLTAGHNIIKHYDTYATFIKFNQIPNDRHNNISRTIIMMTDWEFGQVLQVGDVIESHWKIGDTFTWTGDIWHGVGNFGLADFVCMQVTWL